MLPPTRSDDTRPAAMSSAASRSTARCSARATGPSGWPARWRRSGPDTSGGIGAYIGYAPYCVPHSEAGLGCIVVSEALRDIELMAWDFVMNFARDNRLECVEIDPPAALA